MRENNDSEGSQPIFDLQNGGCLASHHLLQVSFELLQRSPLLR